MKEKFSVDLPRHFIFNTINSIIALCRIDPEKASRVAVAFAQCLNYTSLPAQTVALDEELDALEAYLFVQSIRFTPRFTYKTGNFNIPGKIRKYHVFDIVDICVRDAVSKHYDSILMEIGIQVRKGLLFLEIKINGSNVLNNIISTFEPG